MFYRGQGNRTEIVGTAIVVFLFAQIFVQELAAEDISPGFSTKFSVPPYTMDATILGVDGWQPAGGPTSKQETVAENCRVVEAPWGNHASVLKLQRNVPTLIHLTNQFRVPVEGLVKIEVGMAFDMPIRHHGSHTYVMVPEVGAELTFGIDYSVEGGLYFSYRPPNSDALRKVVVLRINEVAEHETYTFVLTLNLDGALFQIAVHGAPSDGSALNYTAADVECQERPRGLGRSIKAIGLWSSAPAQNSAYLSSLSVLPIP